MHCRSLRSILLASVSLLCALGSTHACYWNAECPYLLHSSKTPYDTVRGDIRDAVTPTGCEATTVWVLSRHGNRNPGDSVTKAIKAIANLKEEIIATYEHGASLLCAQDIQMLKDWKWNSTLETSQSFLTHTGYKELYELGRRIQEKYPNIMNGTTEQFYVRPTNEQRTVTSAMAFVHGLTEERGPYVNVEYPKPIDNVIRPYEGCERYQQEVKSSATLLEALDDFYKTEKFIAVQKSVQIRLGIETILTADEVYALYELCRFDRSWNEHHQSPWCAAFTNDDLLVLEYRDDLRHYYRNGYGSWVNERLGRLPLRDLYETMEAISQGHDKKLIAYFTHDTMMEMVYCALGLYQDGSPLMPNVMNPKRQWKTSYIGNFAVNLIVVLNNCTEKDYHTYRIQFFINEKETDICPLEGCSWQEFRDKFEQFRFSDTLFCSMEYKPEHAEALTSSASKTRFTSILRISSVIVIIMYMFR